MYVCLYVQKHEYVFQIITLYAKSNCTVWKNLWCKWGCESVAKVVGVGRIVIEVSSQLAQALINIYVAYNVRMPTVEIYNSKISRRLLHKLVEDGYLYGFRESKSGKRLLLQLKYYDGKPMLKHLTLVSRPTQCINITSRKLRLSYKTGYVLLLTKAGILTRAEALAGRQGGIVLCQIW